MTDKELVAALQSISVETGSLVCLGCGREHNCGIHGCAILREAAERIDAMKGDTDRANQELHYKS